MGSQVGRKIRQKESVYEKSLERIRDIYDRADRVTVGFSGGKDSTALLNLTLKIAKERNRLPLDVYFFDEEAIVPPTIDYMERVRKNPDINLHWMCVPIMHRNACSRSQPWWFPWNPKEKDKWVRPLPKGAITKLPGFICSYNPETHTSLSTINHLIANPNDGLTVHLMGLRADESIRRYQSVARTTRDNYYSTYFMPVRNKDGSLRMIHSTVGRTGVTTKPCPFVQLASPIYDWSDKDVWRIVEREGLDYNSAYNIYRLMGITAGKQRICPPFGEQPLQSLYTFQEAWPELWDKMLGRVEGVQAAARYSKTELYSYGKKPKRNHTYFKTPMNFLAFLVEKHPRREQKKIVKSIKWLISLHNKQTKNRPIPEDELDPRSGVSWELLYSIALKGDLKERAYNLAVTNARIKDGTRVRAPRKKSTKVKR
jgi:predicted phosphoadenosine phosphosulfate sulfurtransferase